MIDMARFTYIIMLMLLPMAMHAQGSIRKENLVTDSTGHMRANLLEEDWNRSWQFYSKYKTPLVFCYVQKPEWNDSTIQDFARKMLEEWKKNPDADPENGLITCVLNVSEKTNFICGIYGEGEIWETVKADHKGISMLLGKHGCQAHRLVDMMECIVESKPMSIGGQPIDSVINSRENQGIRAIDISGIMSDKDREILDKACENFNNSWGRNLYVATIYAPALNTGNLEYLANEIADKLNINEIELMLINEHNGDFAVCAQGNRRKLSEEKRQEIRKSMEKILETRFANGDEIEKMADKYISETNRTENKFVFACSTGLSAGICCFAPIIIEILILLKKRGHRINEEQERPKGPSQYFSEKK